MDYYAGADRLSSRVLIAKIKPIEQLSTLSSKIEFEKILYEKGYNKNYIKVGAPVEVSHRFLKDSKGTIRFVFEEL